MTASNSPPSDDQTMLRRKAPRFGPGFLVTAAFIGPGTVTTASAAGAQFGFALEWVVVFAVLATVGLQEMSVRLAIASKEGFAESIGATFRNRSVRGIVLVGVFMAILFGNCAFQSGNLSGAAAGLAPSAGWLFSLWVCVIGGGVLTLIWIGRFTTIQRLLTWCVVGMSILFVASAIMSRPRWTDVAAGFVPRPPPESAWWSVIGLIGTTVVPYNLFLHGSAMLERLRAGGPSLPEDQVIRSARWDTVISVAIGGLITWAILISAANAFRDQPQALKSVADINLQLRPILGNASAWAFSAGLFAAGLTSAITAPLAAAYVFAGCFGLSPDLRDWKLKTVATVVLMIGVLVNLCLGQSPSQIILTAQIINGLLLPLMVVLLLIVANQAAIMGKYRNGPITNAIGVLVLIVILIISSKQWIEIWWKFLG